MCDIKWKIDRKCANMKPSLQATKDKTLWTTSVEKYTHTVWTV